jgi:hypothetical protein
VEINISKRETFLRRIPTSTPEFRAHKKFQQLLEKYLQRKQRQEQWEHQV